MIKRFKQGNRASMGVAYGPFFDSAGHVAEDTSAGVAGQTKQILDQIDALLVEANLTKNDLTQVQIWLANIKDFDEMNVVYDKWVADSEKPVRACVESRLADPRMLVEIQVFGYRE
ncbi:RidA family protein [Burkholderia anthina]|nr:RidA family protein [Burkholderia anthina]